MELEDVNLLALFTLCISSCKNIAGGESAYCILVPSVIIRAITVNVPLILTTNANKTIKRVEEWRPNNYGRNQYHLYQTRGCQLTRPIHSVYKLV
jgi:hypothetical protein